MYEKNLVIINNEKILKDENNFFCENIDIKSITEDLGKKFKVTFIARKVKQLSNKRKINFSNIYIASNLFLFLINIFNTFKKEKKIYLIISITPYTFFSFIFLFLFKKKIFIYLRSNGHEEYKAKFGFIGPIIYHIMFKAATFRSSTIIISCQDRLFTKKKSHLVFPSEINSLWLENKKKSTLDKARLLYVGRIRVEKGIFSLVKILNEINLNFELSILGGKIEKFDKKNIARSKITFYPFQNETSSLISFYDKCNIFILPSFTEAHPKVVDESLARGKPVVIFEDIKHIIQNKEGIFVSKRNAESLKETIDFIMQNYQNIQEKMKKNKLPTKQEFILQMSNILSSN
jgi:glycosyltransferase involved in cell wall biosynthesis